MKRGQAKRRTKFDVIAKLNSKLDVLVQLNTKLDTIAELTLLGVKEALTMDDAVLLSGISKSHLYRLTSEQRIPFYKVDGKNKIRFDKEELKIWLLQHRVATMDEINSKASTYVATH